MPNWCGNTVTIAHEDPEMIARAKNAFANGEFLSEFIPLPPEHEKDWYDWCVSNWGTKWDVGTSDGINEFTDTSLVLYFDSAWAPPIRAYERFLELGFTVYATYYEPGVGFAGIWDNGSDDYYELAGLTAQEAADALPAELDEAYGISESMSEFEDDPDLYEDDEDQVAPKVIPTSKPGRWEDD